MIDALLLYSKTNRSYLANFLTCPWHKCPAFFLISLHVSQHIVQVCFYYIKIVVLNRGGM